MLVHRSLKSSFYSFSTFHAFSHASLPFSAPENGLLCIVVLAEPQPRITALSVKQKSFCSLGYCAVTVKAISLRNGEIQRSICYVDFCHLLNNVMNSG